MTFLDLSVTLTGFSEFHLLGTGLSDTYRTALETIVPTHVLHRLLNENSEPATLLADQDLGPVARNVILMWYCGTWTPLPEEWRERNGTSPLDTRHVISAEAYRSGLQWVTAGAHPAGAYQQGFGAWALPPNALTAPRSAA